MLDSQAAELLYAQFGDSVFQARESIPILGQSPGSVFVRLSRMSCSGLITRIEKGSYRVPSRRSSAQFVPVTRFYEESELSKTGGYATATYALTSSAAAYTPLPYIDFFLPPKAALDVEDRYGTKLGTYRPVPVMHPYYHDQSRVKFTKDGIPVVDSLARAFLDLLLIAQRGGRPVSFGYEIVPFLDELRKYWPATLTRARREGALPLLAAIVMYLRAVSEGTDVEAFAEEIVPKLRTRRFSYRFPQLVNLGGREKFDQILAVIEDRTGIILRTDRQEVLSVLRNI